MLNNARIFVGIMSLSVLLLVSAITVSNARVRIINAYVCLITCITRVDAWIRDNVKRNVNKAHR